MKQESRSLLLRRADLGDLPEIRRISGRIRRGDYVPAAFPRWLRDPRSYTMVAEQDGRVVAVSRARLVTHDEAWGQGIRVDPRAQGQGIGRAITRHWPNVLYRRGAQVARVAVLAGNRRSRRMVASSGFRVVARMVWRGWWGQALREARGGAPSADVRRARDTARVWSRISKTRALARTGRLVLAGDYYAVLTRARASRYARRGDAYFARRAFCLLDRRRIGLLPCRGWWIVALGGPPRAAAALARAIVRRAARRGVREVWIDAGSDRAIVRALDRVGFTPPRGWDEVLIMAARLPLKPAPRTDARSARARESRPARRTR